MARLPAQQASLEAETLGYFNRPRPVVGQLSQPINHWRVASKLEWQALVSKEYQREQEKFFTPAELFTPWYGAILARHMLEHRKHNLHMEGQPLKIVEIGGGNGTLARDILNWLRTERPEVYKVTEYTSLEVSSRLAAQQYDNVMVQAGHRERYRILQGNAWDRAAWGSAPEWGHTFVLMMEVLDNLPHDRVYRTSSSAPWMQTVVEVDRGTGSTAGSGKGSSVAPSIETGPWKEELEPVSDELLQRALAAVYRPLTLDERFDNSVWRVADFVLGQSPDPVLPRGHEAVFVPTACMSFLEILHTMRPNHSLIAGDFDALPRPRIPGRNAPIVTSKAAGKSQDHDTILVPWGSCDIFFPTDFEALCRLYRAAAEGVWGPEGDAGGSISAAHYKQGAVMRRYREMVHTATLTSFNPMVDDFLNTRFFMGDALGRKSSSAPRPPGSRSSTGSGSKAGADEAGQAAQSSGWGLGSWRGAWGGGKSGNTSKQPPSSTGGGGASSTPGGPPAGGAQHQKQQQQQQQQGSLKGQVWGLQQGASQDPPGPQGPKPDILGGGRIGGRQEQRQRQRQLGKGPDLSALPDWARQRLLEKQRKQGQQQQGPGQRQQQGQWEPPAHQQPAVQQGLSEAQQVSGEQQALSQQRQQRQAQQQQPSQGDPVGPGIKRPNG